MFPQSKSVPVCFQAIPVPQVGVSSTDEAQAAKRRCLPSGSAPSTRMETTNKPPCSLTTAAVTSRGAEHLSIHTSQTSQPLPRSAMTLHEAPSHTNGIQMDVETPMDTSVALTDALTESTLASDAMLTPQPNPFFSGRFLHGEPPQFTFPSGQ